MRRRRSLLVSAVGVALALTGCAPSAPDDDNGGSGDSASTLTIATTTDVVNLNPLLGNSRTDSWVTDLMYPRLLTIDKDGSKQPYLAKEWGYSKDGLTGYFDLRDDFKWSNGQPVTAADVAYSINVVKEQNPTGNVVYGFLSNVKKAVAVSDDRVEVQLSHPDSTVIPEVGFWQVVVPEKQFSQHDPVEDFTNDSDWVSAGPFKLTEVNRGQSYTLERTTPYPMVQGGEPAASKVVFRVYPDVNTEILALQKGEVDVIANALPPAEVKHLQDADDIDVEEVPGLGFTHLSFNMDVPVLKDVRVRQAISHAIDYDAIRKVAVQGQAVSANSSPITPSLKEYADPSWQEYDYDVDKAKQLLADAGVKDLTLTMIYSMQDPVISAWATMVRDSLKDAGITLKLQGLDRNTYLAKTESGEYDVYAGSYAIMDEPVSNMSLQYLPDAAINRSHVDDPKLTSIIESAQSTTDAAKRKALVQQAATYVHDQVFEDIMYVQNLYVAHRDDWTGFVVRPSELLSIVDPESLANAHPVN